MKYISITVLNTPLEYIKNNANVIHICSSVPTAYSQLTTYSLGSASLNTSNFSITKIGVVSGRRISILDTEITVSSTGNAICVAIADTVEGTLLYVAELTTVSVTNGSIYSIKEWDIEFRDPI
jgi:hypothetical protein